MASNYFESEEALESYLLAHYGTPEQLGALNSKARQVGGFVTDFITEPLRHLTLNHRRRALDLGCATGRGTFELRRFFDEVVGIDRSHAFISAAERMKQERQLTTKWERTRGSKEPIRLELPSRLVTDKVEFRNGDACDLDSNLGLFDLVILTQLIDRVADPAQCLKQMGAFVEPGGWLVISTACNWLEKFTPREKWLGTRASGIIADSKPILAPGFSLHHHFHMQYFIRERPHWYEWSIAEVSIWQRS